MQEDGDIKCKTEGQQTDCTIKTEELPLGEGISQLNIDLQCSVFSCTSGATRTVSVENLRNRLNGAEYTEQLNI